jgi:hypothetical protein
LARRPERSRATRFVILGVLNTFGPLSGYGVKEVIAQTIDFMWSESYGQLYPELKQQARLAQFAVRAQIESVAVASPDFVNWMIVLRSGEMQAEMRVRWTEEALALLDAWEHGGATAVLTTSRAQANSGRSSGSQ